MLEPLCAGGLIGGAALLLGCLLTPVVTRAFLVTLPTTLTLGQDIDVDRRTLLFACVLGGAGIAAMTTAAMGLVARHARTPSTFRGHGAPSTAPLHMRRAFLFSQLLVVASLIYIGTVAVTLFSQLDEHHFGFRPAGLFEVQLDAGLDDDALKRVLAGLRAMPGIDQASGTDSPPLKRGRLVTFVSDTPPTSVDDRGREALGVMVSPGHFRTLGLTLLGGRDFTDEDLRSKERLLVVSRRLSSTPAQPWQAVGTTMFVGGLPYAVIGVVDDVRGEGADQPLSPYVYTKPWIPISTLLVRTELPPAATTAAVQQVLRDVGTAAHTVRFVRPLDDYYRDTVAPHRARAVILSSLSMIALLVTAGGVFGLVSLMVNAGLRDVAIRIALGSGAATEAARLVGRVTTLALVAGLAGVGVAMWIAQASAQWPLAGKGIDVTAAVLSLVVCVTAVVGAALLPARRLLTISPADILRDE